jgi:hypothetical protein
MALGNATTQPDSLGFILSGCPVRTPEFAGVAQLTSPTQVRVFFESAAAKSTIGYLAGTVTVLDPPSQEGVFQRSLNNRYLYAQLPFPVKPPAVARVTLGSQGRRAEATTVTFTEFVSSLDDIEAVEPPRGASREEALAGMRRLVADLETATERGDRQKYVPLVQQLRDRARVCLEATEEQRRASLEPVVAAFGDAVTSMSGAVDKADDGGASRVLDEIRDRLVPRLAASN